ncbi:MAG: pyridine nucleotide-disulfide oxidoreductase, partial [Bacteroidota bacterium]|nr:pyridine nucleotide-disulfide oxidoreductase [Bacteroidota bacterium]
FLQNKISRQQMEDQYTSKWIKEFERRLRTGRIIQSFFGKEWITNIFISALKPLPILVKKLISATHGKAF